MVWRNCSRLRALADGASGRNRIRVNGEQRRCGEFEFARNRRNVLICRRWMSEDLLSAPTRPACDPALARRQGARKASPATRPPTGDAPRRAGEISWPASDERRISAVETGMPQAASWPVRYHRGKRGYPGRTPCNSCQRACSAIHPRNAHARWVHVCSVSKCPGRPADLRQTRNRADPEKSARALTQASGVASAMTSCGPKCMRTASGLSDTCRQPAIARSKTRLLQSS